MKKLCLLQSCNIAKLGTTLTFQGIQMENCRKNEEKIVFFHLKNLITFHPFTQLWRFLAILEKQKICRKVFLFFIFSWYFRISRPKILQIQKIGFFSPLKSVKYQNLKKLFPTDFFFLFCLQLGQKWPKLSKLVKSYKIFKMKKNIFFFIFPAICHANTLNA